MIGAIRFSKIGCLLNKGREQTNADERQALFEREAGNARQQVPDSGTSVKNE